MEFPSQTPDPPYYAVIFSSMRTEGDHGYAAMADKMEALASEQPGFLGIESVRDASGKGITVSYWESEAAIHNWQRNSEHRHAQALGKSTWYAEYQIHIAKVERAYGRTRG